MIDINSSWFVSHSKLLIESFHNAIGEELIQFSDKIPSDALFSADFIVLSHNGESDPVLNYGNQRALDLWEMNWEKFTSLPSRYTAEQEKRQTRAELLEKVKIDGFIKNYSGMRISSTGKRFIIKNAIVWMTYPGQAAMFKDWKYI